MYERMLDKQKSPSIEDMKQFCGENAERFDFLNHWITETFGSTQKIVFPYGNSYGWGVGHYQKQKLICNIFAEKDAFTVMIRMSDARYGLVYPILLPETQKMIDDKYPCGDGGWIHFRVTGQESLAEIQKLLNAKSTSTDEKIVAKSEKYAQGKHVSHS